MKTAARSTSIAIPSLILITVFSCTKVPVPEFAFTPEVNPEAGDTIRFTNTSTDADSYVWDFGDGSGSEEETPYHIFSDAGNYEVTLKASNEKKSDETSEWIEINPPTILDIQIFGLAEDTAILEGAEVWVYDDIDDANNFVDVPPVYAGVTDSEGIVVFYNLEPVKYFVIIVKLEEEGYWFSGWELYPLEQNEATLLALPASYYLYEEDASLKGAIKQGLPHFNHAVFPVTRSPANSTR